MSVQLTSIILTAEQVLSLAQAADTFISLLNKIKTSAPEAWAEVSSDFGAALDGWNNGRNPQTTAQGNAQGTGEPSNPTATP